VGENALLRFYVLHCVFIPVIVTVLIAIHFWRIRKDGGMSGPRKGDGVSTDLEPHEALVLAASPVGLRFQPSR
jgi:quinol-cytochrome oxidoreductase complex cytochrome b subunit